jgi:apolipoprotein N-acyltransferase
VRAANTGISAVTDPFGRIVRSLPLGVEGVLDAPLPRQIVPPMIAKAGDAMIGLVLGACTILLLTRRRTL